MGEGGSDPYGALGPAYAARARAAGVVGMPQAMAMMQGNPGLGPGPGAAWGPVHGGAHNNGQQLIMGYPEAMRRDQDGMGQGRNASNPSDFFFSVDEALSGSPHARTCAQRHSACYILSCRQPPVRLCARRIAWPG